ncbi:alpha/beta fold hydrolase [Georgenia sp. AZ-5]|uniref:alpha/beta fold hydrolase n=1 Tax=Georgenia sp. AZ-5 TaxID=3367526 RepID=UPI0037547AE6
MDSNSPPEVVAVTTGDGDGSARKVRVNGGDVHYVVTGEGDRDLVLVHGLHAHHLWWHGVIPFLVPHCRIISVDLSGHGESQHRTEYTLTAWTTDLAAVIEDAGSSRPVLVGHSNGGRVAVTTAARYPGMTAGVVMFDSVVRPPWNRPGLRWGQRARPLRYSATREAAIARFRLVPEQPDPPAELLAPVAAHSVHEGAGGWTWKYDQRSPIRLEDELLDWALATADVPLRYVYAELSVVADAEGVEYVRKFRPPGGLEILELAGLHHHLILERPDLCAEVVTDFVHGLPSDERLAEARSRP